MSKQKRKKHTPEQIVHKLQEAEAALAAGKSIGQVCQMLQVSEQSYYRWKSLYGGIKRSEAKVLKKLHDENSRLKRLVADQALDIAMLKELVEGKW